MGVGVFFVVVLSFLSFSPVVYDTETVSTNTQSSIASTDISFRATNTEPVWQATHIATPKPLKAIYMTSWVAGTRDWRASLVRLIEETELNSIIIDIKDYTGRIAFEVENPLLVKYGAEEIRIRDVKEFIELLHKKGIYVIGRITVFQDPHLSKVRPDLAIKKESNKEEAWEDYKGLSYIDPGAKDAWDYIVALSRESYRIGFDELNFDYIRFPSDGNMKDIYFPFSEERVTADWRYGKAKIIRDFFAYLYQELGDIRGDGVKLSADLFGMVTTNSDDLNVGQVLEYALPYFDYIAPMVYPSHYPKNFNGYPNPNDYVYEVVRFSMDSAVKRTMSRTTRVLELGDTPIASTSPQLYNKKVFDKYKLRPWLQDFDYGGEYGVEEIRGQIQAVYDAGLDSWMLWDPANRYTVDAFLPAE